MKKIHKCDIEHLAKIMDTIDIGIIYVDENEKIAFINNKAEEIRKISSKERIGTKVQECHNEKVRANVSKVIDQFRNGDHKSRHRTIRAGGRVFDNTYNVVLDDEDKFDGIVLVSQDITDKINLERELKRANEYLENKVRERTQEIEEAFEQLKVAQKHLVHGEKMNAMGKFISGLAHEINNPLDGIQNCIRTVKNEPDDKKQLDTYLDLSLEGLTKIELLVKRLLDYAKPHPSQKLDVNINKLLDDILVLVNIRLRDRNIKVQKNYESKRLILNGDPNYLEQIFMNLILNASDAMDNGGTLTISTKNQDEFNVHVMIKDTGSGIPEKNIDKIFDPFFTTKQQIKGTGLGLYLSYNAVKEHKGEIKVKSELNRGTEFEITLPKININEESRFEHNEAELT